MTKEEFLREIDAFKSRHGISDWRLAKEAARDAGWLSRLRNGKNPSGSERGLSVAKMNRVIDFMRAFEEGVSA